MIGPFHGAMILLTATTLLAVSCTSATEADRGASAAASEVSFCSSWTGMQKFVENDEPIDEAGLTEYLDLRGAASGLVPDDVADRWDAIVSWDEQMIEVLYSVNFQVEDITEQMVARAFGGLEKADVAAADQEQAIDAVDLWSLTNCGGGTTDTQTFCDLWTDIYLGLSGMTRYEDEPEQVQRDLADQIAQADVAAPQEIRDSWDAFAGYHLARYDILVTVNFEEGRVTDEYLTDAYGSPEAAADAAADAAAAVEVIEEWSKTGCGDFCVRGGEAITVLERIASGQVGGTDPESLYRRAGQRRMLDAVSLIAPQELKTSWDLAMAETFDWFDLFETREFDHDRMSEPDMVRLALEAYRRGEYLTWDFGDDPDRYPGGEAGVRNAIDAWRSGAELRNDLMEELSWLVTSPPSGRPGWGSLREEVDDWTEGNCADVARPGTLVVVFPEIRGGAGDFLILSVLPAGSMFADFANGSDVQFGSCSMIDRDPWGIRAEEGGRRIDQMEEQIRLRHPGAEEQLCGFGEPEALDPGDYTLVVAQYEGLVHSVDQAKEPSHCLAVDLTISGNTRLQLPELVRCDVDRTVIGADDWRSVEPVSASMPGAGALKVRLVDHLVPPSLESEHGGVELSVVVLPKGTTLNEVGREQVFPSGVVCVRLLPERELPPELESRSVEIPIGSPPPFGLRSCLDPLWLNGLRPLGGDSPPEAPAEDSKLPLSVLAPGTYDVRVAAFSEGDEERKLCASFEVRIDGDTVVDLPDLVEC